jgi:PAS domain S-box-containing protein
MEKSTILVVDDSMSNLLLVKDILSSEPEYDVITESQGENVVKVLNSNKVDLILLDIMMPKVDGFDVCRKIKADLAFKDIPIIFLTAKIDEASLLAGFELGGVDYIKKPFLISEFIARIKTHLQLKKTNEKLKNELFQHYLTQQMLQTSQNELSVKNKIASIFLSEKSDEVYPKLLEEILKYVGLDYGVIGYFNAENKLVCPSIYSGEIESDKNYIYDIQNIGDIALSVLKKRTVVQKNKVSPLFFTKAKVGCMISSPVVYRNSVIGLVAVAGRRDYADSFREKLEDLTLFLSPVMFNSLERKKAETLLKISEEKYRTLFNNNNDAIVVFNYIDGDYKVYDINRSGLLLTGYSKEELTGSGAQKFIEPVFWQKYSDNMNQALNGERQSFETYIINRAGKNIPVEINMDRLTLQDGRNFVFNVIRDLTFRKDVDKQLFDTIVETQEKERLRFAKDVHDGIGSYLTSLLTYINLLASSKISVMEMPDIFEEMKELVMEAAKESKNIANDLVPDILNNFGLVAGIKNLAKHVFVDGNMQFILECGNFVEPQNKMLKTSLFRIVNELFNNAVKYSHGTKMILILETENNYTRLKYIDNGIGFESEDIMHQIHDKKVSGLKNIESRVANFNGTLDIKTSVGNGLEINIVVLN